MEESRFVTSNELQDAIDGNQEACKTIYNKTFKSVYFFAYGFFQDESLAKDVTQTVYLKVFKNLESLKEVEYFGIWIKKITYNTCISVATKKKLLMKDLSDNDSIDNYSNNKDDVNKNLINKEITEAVFQSLQTMPYKFRSVGVLRYYEDLSYAQIADVLDISEGTVKSRLNTINQHLKTDLTDKGITPKTMLSTSVPATVITTAYQMLMNQGTLSSQTIDSISKYVFGGGTVSSLGVLKVALAVVILGGAGYGGTKLFNEVDNKKDNVSVASIAPIKQDNPIEVEVEEEKPVIQNISYNKNWTNQPIDINVQTTNQNYDQLLINDKNVKNIISNGNYSIKLIKDNQVVATSSISISNIDTLGPDVVSSQNGNTFTLNISDNLSGVSSIKMTRNNVVSNDYSYNSKTGILVVTTNDNDKDIIKVFDKAGNVTTITIE
ncbi:MAG: sigma-70 family RNA polymerase sigma factor [Thomasclavelia sp.]|nr:sigma-70 family RNA polymerase sigma factor [Thomasclavelia sp.]